MIKKVKNIGATSYSWCGIDIGPSSYYEIQAEEEVIWKMDEEIKSAILNGTAAINDGSQDLLGNTAMDYLLAYPTSIFEGNVKYTGMLKGAKEVFYPAPFDSTYGDYATLSASQYGSINFSFYIPGDFTSLTELKLVFISSETLASKTMDFYSDYGAVDESSNSNSESNSGYVFSADVNELSEVDVSSVFSSVSPLDHCGLKVDIGAIGASALLHFLGLRLKHN